MRRRCGIRSEAAVGTSDAQTFERMLDKLQTRGVAALYLEGTDVNVGKYVFPLAAFGLACGIKVWPLLLAPVFLFSAGHACRRVAFCATALGVGAAAAMPCVLAAPGLIFTRVFDYPSLQGLWGVTCLRPDAAHAARTAMFACVLAAAAYMYQRMRPLPAQCAAVPWTVAAVWRRHSISARLISARASSATADMPSSPAPPR